MRVADLAVSMPLSMPTGLRRALALSLLALLASALAGCGPAGLGSLAVLALVISMAALGAGGCSASHVPEGSVDASTPDARPPEGDGGGSWQRCCEGGRLTTCFCPAGASCNYGMGLVDCGDGTCTFSTEWPPDPERACHPERYDAGPPDAGPSDAGGTWEPCCEDGVITTCFCPGGLACNYGWFSDCGEGTCALGGCPDAGAP